MAGSDATPPPSSGLDDDSIDEISSVRPSTFRVLPSAPTAPPVRPSLRTSPPVAADYRAGPVGENAEHGTATGPEEEPEEDPI